MDKAEIARKLRYCANDGSKAPLNELKSILAMESGASYRDVFHALADLLGTKMCENLQADKGKNGWMGFECSECGAVIGGADAELGAPEEICFVIYTGCGCGYSSFSYCPHCGAKVVSGE